MLHSIFGGWEMRLYLHAIASLAIALFLLGGSVAYSQKQPILSGTLKPGGVSSRNMELLDVIEMHPENHDQFETVTVTYDVGGTPTTKNFIIAATEDESDDPVLKLVDVTNPRAVNRDFLRLYAKGTATNPEDGEVNFEYYQVFQNQETAQSNTYKSDVFLIVWVGNVRVATIPDLINARFMIFNLTEACSLVANGGSNTITVHDASDRDVTLGTTVTGNSNIYVGYVEYDPNWITLESTPAVQSIHSLTVDSESGLMIMVPNKFTATGTSPYVPKAMIDCFDLRELTNTSVINPTGSTLGVLPRLTSSVTNKPIEVDGLSSSALGLPRDISIKKLASGQVRLSMAVPTGASTLLHNSTSYPRFGGVLTADFDFTTANAVDFTNQHEWYYDTDRESPLDKEAAYSGWEYRLCHTAVPFYHTSDDVYVLTADEMSNPKWNPLDNNPVNELRIETSTGRYYGGIDRLHFDGYTASAEDDRRAGSFTRVWKASEDSEGLVLESGSSNPAKDGPLTYYDPVQSLEPDDLYYSAGRTASATSRTIATTAAFGVTSTNRLAPISTHRPFCIPPTASNYEVNNNDVFVSNYAQGIRVINLTDVEETNHPVLEKGFFDFIPLLTYDANDPYFYKLSQQYFSEYSNYSTIAPQYPIYWLGVFDSRPDFGPNRIGTNGTGTLPADEKFVYGLAYGEGKFSNSFAIPTSTTSGSTDVTVNPGVTISADPSEVLSEEGRNWLPHGGYLVLRYFDEKIGGTISGYSGVGSGKWSNRSYRTVNLQGDFSVERDVTIATGACVQLLPGHENDPGIFPTTSMASSTSPQKTITVYGTLNISVPDGDALGTDIVIDVPVIIKNGGTLNVYNIRSGKKVVFAKTVTCEQGGTWKMHERANVELLSATNYCHGMFYISGTSGNEVTFTGRRATSSVSAAPAAIQGRPTYTSFPKTYDQSSAFVVQYGNCSNVYFNMKKFQTVYGERELDHSTFDRTIVNGSEVALVNIEEPYAIDNTANRYYRAFLDIRDCEFSSSTFSPLNYRDVGLIVKNCYNVTALRTEFDNLHSGAAFSICKSLKVSDCEFYQSANGLLMSQTNGVVCGSTFNANEFSSHADQGSTIEFYDNSYTATNLGSGFWSGGKAWYRNNDFLVYARGVSSFGASMYLRDRVQNPTDFEFGRNNFLTPNATYNYPGTANTLAVYDLVNGLNSQMFVDCGFNDFTVNSTYHVYSTVLPHTFDGTNNRWPYAGGIYQSRTNGAYTGTDLDQQQDVDEECHLVAVNSNCNPVPCAAPLDYLNWGDPDIVLYNKISSLNADVTNTAIALPCRKTMMWEYVEAVSKTDSTALYTQLASTMASIAANTLNPNHLRSAALMVKANGHMFQGQYDSARVAYTNVVTNFTTSIDSIPANWSLRLLDVLQDVSGKEDSLTRVYIDREIADLRRPITSGGLSKTGPGVNNQETPVAPLPTVDQQLVFESIIPNPVSNQCKFEISSLYSGKATIEIVSLTGSVILSRTEQLVAGRNTINESVSNFATGVYIVRCTMNGVSVSQRMDVQP